MRLHLKLAGCTRNRAYSPQHQQAVFVNRRQHCNRSGDVLHDAQRAAIFQSPNEIIATRKVQTVRQPNRIHAAIIQGRGQCGQSLGVRLPGLRQDTGQSRFPRARLLKLNIRWIAEVDHSCCLTSPRGLVQQSFDHGHLTRPRPGRSPAAIEQHQKAITLTFGFFIGVQDRTGEPDNHRRHGQSPQQQKPPRRAVSNSVVVLQPQEQRHTRKPAADRCRRNGAQDEPQDRQGDQRDQHPRGGKTYGQTEDHCRRSIAR